MSLTFGFYDSRLDSGGNQDRTYTAEQMSSLFDGIIQEGVLSATTALGGGITNSCFKVSVSTGMNILVGTGKAWFNHTWTRNDSTLTFPLDTAHAVYDRIDAVVLEINKNDTARINSIKVLKGSPSGNPSKPTLTKSGGIYQYPLAYVTVTKGSSSISATNIEITTNTSACPYANALLQQTSIDAHIQSWTAEKDALLESLSEGLDEWMTDQKNEYLSWVATQQSNYNTWIAGKQTEFNNWYDTNTANFNTWKNDKQTEFTTWENNQKTDFLAWYNTLQDILDENVAAKLANAIMNYIMIDEVNKAVIVKTDFD